MRLAIKLIDDAVTLVAESGEQYAPADFGLTGSVMQSGQPCVTNAAGVLFVGYVEVEL